MRLVSIELAKQHLRVDYDDEDAIITAYVEAASEAVINYLKSGADYFLDSAGFVPEDSAGDPLGVPGAVRAATLLQIGFLWKDRDNDEGKAYEMGYLPRPVTALLYPLRDPALA
jgi:hypothetical protein